MIIDWYCPFCNEKHISQINFTSQTKVLFLNCISCNKECKFYINNLNLVINCRLDNDKKSKSYIFTIFT